MEEKKVRTFEEIMAGFDRIEKQQEKNAKELTRIEKLQEENAKGFAELREQQKESREKSEKEWAEYREQQEKRDKKSAEEWADLRKSMKDMSKEIGGIGESNGKFSETYFYNTLLNSMRFGGKDFDEIDKGLKRSKKLPDGDKLNGEYDVVMYNGNTIALIEVKYKVKKNHIDNLATTQLNIFKRLFPQYANFDFYLGIAGLSFEDNTEKDALERGIGILKPKGENVEIIDDNLKVY